MWSSSESNQHPGWFQKGQSVGIVQRAQVLASTRVPALREVTWTFSSLSLSFLNYKIKVFEKWK